MTKLIKNKYYKIFSFPDKKDITILQYLFECPMYANLHVFKVVYPRSVEDTPFANPQCYFSCTICKHKCFSCTDTVVLSKDEIDDLVTLDQFQEISKVEFLIYKHEYKF